MLHARRDHMAAAIGKRTRRPDEREIVRFGPAGREDDFACGRSDETRNLVTRSLYGGPGGRAFRVHAGGVAEKIVLKRAHRVGDLASQRRGGVVIEVRSSPHFSPAPYCGRKRACIAKTYSFRSPRHTV